MSDLVGQTLSGYEVLEQIGAGGMGEVFLARDSKLERNVAIKLLPDAFARDKERMLRFDREAKVLASLNHPNIAAIYGFEESDDKRFLVLELVEGDTLAQRVKAGPLPVDEALEVARQIAEALEAAHEKGIIHRDLKPANVMVTPDGTVKVLDFGLARALTDDSRNTQVTAESPTITADYTKPGVVLGTAPYMSPEQARGRPVDKRSDIWSFGCVLYNILTGANPFEGETTTDVIAKILETQPDFEALPSSVPPKIHDLLRRCLEKDRKRRLRDIGDAALELQGVIQPPEWSTTSIQTVAQSKRRPGVTWLIAALFVIALITVATQVSRRSPDDREGISALLSGAKFTKLTDLPGSETSPTLSPDGKTVVYVSQESGNSDIFSLRVGGQNPINLTEEFEADDTQPAFSPDGDSIAFRSERQGGGIFVMGATGESPRRLTDFGYNPAFSPNGRELLVCTEGITQPFSRNVTSALWAVDVKSGSKRELFEGDAVQPNWSPAGHRVAYWTIVQGGQRDIFTIPASGGAAVAVTEDAATDWNPVWSPDGRYLYYSSDRNGRMNLWRVRIDEESGQALGTPEPVTAGVSGNSQLLSISRNGLRIAFVSHVVQQNIQKIAFDPTTGEVVDQPMWVTRGSTQMRQPDVSRDGKWLTYASAAKQEDIYVASVDGHHQRKLTNDAHKDRAPQWSPDGTRIAFYSDRGESYEAYSIRVDGSALTQLTNTDGRSIWYPTWSPDGTRLAYFDPEGIGAAILDLGNPMNGQAPSAAALFDEPDDMPYVRSWSPDGSTLACQIVSGPLDQGIATYSLESKTLRKFTDSGSGPLWLSDSRRILFTDDDKLFLLDTKNDEHHEILTIAPDTFFEGLGRSPDDRWIYFSRVSSEADIWLIDLE